MVAFVHSLSPAADGMTAAAPPPLVPSNQQALPPLDLSSYGISTQILPSIHPALLSFVELHKHYQTCSSRSDSSDSAVSPPSFRENVIVKHDSKRKKDLVKDNAYWERRKKNNDAAKRSRDSRRQKEDEMASRASSLEQDNLRLRGELDQLKLETEQLRAILLSSASTIRTPVAIRGIHHPSFMSNLLVPPNPTVIRSNEAPPVAAPFPLQFAADSTQRGSVLVSNYTSNSS